MEKGYSPVKVEVRDHKKPFREEKRGGWVYIYDAEDHLVGVQLAVFEAEVAQEQFKNTMVVLGK